MKSMLFTLSFDEDKWELIENADVLLKPTNKGTRRDRYEQTALCCINAVAL